ncbi:hypothetical protein [Streptomyces sp. AC550_RSS872]|uniref:hypothetical protein n=1 Tax=Streptomyces sp. AC550_RSS872 TaxID=2823689 RepID=UPI001C262082|nr:hypothetical protein [Streptomyces sp. AC550_RSS872]
MHRVHRDQRKLQRLWPADDDSDAVRLLEHQGPGALTVDRAQFEAALSARRGSLKSTETDRRRLSTHMRRTLRSPIPAGCVPSPDSWLTGHRDTPSP